VGGAHGGPGPGGAPRAGRGGRGARGPAEQGGNGRPPAHGGAPRRRPTDSPGPGPRWGLVDSSNGLLAAGPAGPSPPYSGPSTAACSGAGPVACPRASPPGDAQRRSLRVPHLPWPAVMVTEVAPSHTGGRRLPSTVENTVLRPGLHMGSRRGKRRHPGCGAVRCPEETPFWTRLPRPVRRTPSCSNVPRTIRFFCAPLELPYLGERRASSFHATMRCCSLHVSSARRLSGPALSRPTFASPGPRYRLQLGHQRHSKAHIPPPLCLHRTLTCRRAKASVKCG